MDERIEQKNGRIGEKIRGLEKRLEDWRKDQRIGEMGERIEQKNGRMDEKIG